LTALVAGAADVGAAEVGAAEVGAADVGAADAGAVLVGAALVAGAVVGGGAVVVVWAAQDTAKTSITTTIRRAENVISLDLFIMFLLNVRIIHYEARII
jgi:hypothetical protein